MSRQQAAFLPAATAEHGINRPASLSCLRLDNCDWQRDMCCLPVPAVTSAALNSLIESGENVNEVEAAGGTALHFAAFEGWTEGVARLIELGAKVNASNNAGDTPWHLATYMRNDEVVALLEKNGANKKSGKVLVQEHVPKVKDFYSKECWAHHPKPYEDFMRYKIKEHDTLEAERKKAIRV